MKKILSFFVLLALFFPVGVLASTAQAETEVDVQASGNVQVYQEVETTINGQTVRKESNQPGKLELKMEQTGNNAPEVTFNQEQITPTIKVKSLEQVATSEIEEIKTKNQISSFITPVVDFIRSILSGLTSWLK